MINADKPRKDPKDDRLGYASFAKHLAEAIVKTLPVDGLVIAVYAPWGSGKSTLLEFINYYLSLMDEGQQPIVIRFNPWWFSGQQDLTKQFFVQLQMTLATRLSEVGNQIKAFVKLFGKMVSKAANDIGEPFLEMLDSEQDLSQEKEKVSDLLRKQNKKVLVIIDDIDRLTSSEIRLLFGLIKSLGDFPNLIYLLAFDKDVVVKALEEAQGIKGEVYLEKIVQIPFELPLPSQTTVRTLLLEQLPQILEGTPADLFDDTHWRNVFFDGIQHFVATPRDVVRLINALALTYPLVLGEVNAVDFVAIETVRIFCPKIYHQVRLNPEMYVGDLFGYVNEKERAQFQEFHSKAFASLDCAHLEALKSLLTRLFPKLQNLGLGHISFGDSYWTTWRRQRRICTKDAFEVYFRLFPMEGELSQKELRELLVLSNDKESFCQSLRDLSRQKRQDGISRLRQFLDAIPDQAINIPHRNIEVIVLALYSIGDELILSTDKRPFVPFDGNEVAIWRVTWILLRLLNPHERSAILKKGIQEGDALSIIVDQMQSLRTEHGEIPDQAPEVEEQRLIPIGDLTDCKKLAIEKIQISASTNELLNTPNLPAVLAFWNDLDPIGATKWVSQIAQDVQKFPSLIASFVRPSYRTTVGDVGVETYFTFHLEWLTKYVDKTVLCGTSDILNASDLDEQHALALHLLREECNRRADGNKNPTE